MLRIALCDDMPVYIEKMRHLLDHWDEKPTHFHVESFDNGDALLQAHTATPFDIIFLDVVMPLLNGIETAKEIRQTDKSVRIVFVSSERNYAVDSYAVKADNYLLKPVVAENFYTCIQEIYAQLQTQSKSLTIRTSTATYRVESNNIEYIEAQNKNVLFYLLDGRILHANHALYTYEELLGIQDGFYKCHRSYLVNMHHIETYSAKFIQLRSGGEVPISRGNQKNFENVYFDFLFGKVGDK